MGNVWLGSLPDVLRSAGLVVDVYPGWEFRSRSTGGYDALLAVQVHHTASRTSPANDMQYMWGTSPDRPIGACYLARDGRWTVGAAGATNTSGRGGPLATSAGTIPLDAANRYVLSVEAANDGIGEVWPDAQLQSYVTGVDALCRAYGLKSTHRGDVHGHFEWTTRKVDPAGPSWYAVGTASWNMDKFRSDVTNAHKPPPPPPEGDDVLLALVRHPSHLAVYCQYSNGTKTWIPDPATHDVLKFLGAPEVTVMPNDAWMKATGPIVGPKPSGVDGWGVPV